MSDDTSKRGVRDRSRINANQDYELRHWEPRRAGYLRRRKAAPASMPLPRTLAWAASLPADVRPTSLLSRYARIANLIAATWPDAKAFERYMESLLTDKRGGSRQGFPVDVLRELTTLALHHSENLLGPKP